jgi:hypothetical protein
LSPDPSTPVVPPITAVRISRWRPDPPPGLSPFAHQLALSLAPPGALLQPWLSWRSSEVSSAFSLSIRHTSQLR